MQKRLLIALVFMFGISVIIAIVALNAAKKDLVQTPSAKIQTKSERTAEAPEKIYPQLEEGEVIEPLVKTTAKEPEYKLSDVPTQAPENKPPPVEKEPSEEKEGRELKTQPSPRQLGELKLKGAVIY